MRTINLLYTFFAAIPLLYTINGYGQVIEQLSSHTEIELMNAPICGRQELIVSMSGADSVQYDIEFAWNPSGIWTKLDAVFQEDSSWVVGPLGPGRYHLRVRSINSEIHDTSNIIIARVSPEMTIDSMSIVDPHCNENNGEIEFFYTGGIEPMMYSVSGIPYDADGPITNLRSGIYDVRIVDSIGCFRERSITLTQTGIPLFESLTVEHASNCQTNDGSITGVVVEGVPPYSYSLNDSMWADSLLFDSLFGGQMYTISVNDFMGCVSDTALSLECSITSLASQLLEELAVYPIPFNNELKIDNIAYQNVQEISLIDTHGKVHELIKKKEQQEFTLETENLADGVYILRILTNKEIVEKMVMKFPR